MKQEHLDKYKKLGLKISYYRKINGLTQLQFAEKIDKTNPPKNTTKLTSNFPAA